MIDRDSAPEGGRRDSAPAGGTKAGAADVERIAGEMESQPAEAVLAWALATYHPRLALAWSGAEDIALVDMILKIDPAARVFLLDTGRLNPETYNLVDRVRDKYGCQVEVMFPDAGATQQMVRAKGMNLFYDSIDSRKECCGVRKVEPLGRMLDGLDAWITGLRRDQSVTRTEVRKVEIDAAHGGILKINPLADWTHEQVWSYIKGNSIPYNKLHDLGYASIGCAPCTRAISPGEDIRAGRWWWENPDTRECGLHIKT